MDADWNVSGLVIEGVSGSGKTELLRALLKSDLFRDPGPLSTLVLTEHHTQRVIEKKAREEGLEPRDNLELLEQHVGYLESSNARLEAMEWCRRGQTKQRLRYVFERFHLTHAVQYDHMDWSAVKPIDRRLDALNGTLVLLTADRDTLARRLFCGRDETWLGYIQRFGETRDEIVRHFVKQQEELVSLAERSRLNLVKMDTGRISISDAVVRLLDSWRATL